MSYLDEIALKRQESTAHQMHTQSVDTSRNDNERIVSTLSDSKNATKEDMASIIKELQQMHLTTLLEASKEKPRQMNITDSAAYVGDQIEKLEDRLIEKLSDPHDKAETKKLFDELHDAIQAFNTERKNEGGQITTAMAKIQKSIAAIDMQPQITVEPPSVTVQSAKVDFKPLQDTIREYFTQPDTDEKLDLECYRAQDIIDHDKNTQYVGFINPTGSWYIIENKVKENSMRYVFGNGGYAEAFTNAPQYEYLLLNEAINALTS